MDLFHGTMHLISEGVRRHSDDKRIEWASLVERLIGLPIEIIDIDDSALSRQKLKALSKGDFQIERDTITGSSQIWGAIDDRAFVRVQLAGIAEQQLRITAFLLLNELGRVPEHQQNSHLSKIQQKFSFSIRFQTRSQLHLDDQQQKRVDRGDVVLAIDQSAQSSETLKVVSRYKTNDQYIVLGPIPIYNATPASLLIGLVVFSLSITAIIMYRLIRVVERKIDDIRDVVIHFGAGSLQSRVTIHETEGKLDSVNDLGKGINTMADRIEALIVEQKELSRAISHELKTPIARMKFRVQLLLDKLAEKESLGLEQGLTKLSNDITELELLVEELLIYQRLDTQEIQLAQNVDLNLLVRELIDEIYEPYQSKDLELTIPDKPITIPGNEIYLRRMIQNLLVNAFKHANSKVALVVSESPVTISVSDNGEGIPKDKRARIFHAFVRLDSSRNRETGGYGLGLSIVKKIVEYHRARIDIHDAELGGAKFEVIFPNGQPLLSSDQEVDERNL